MIKKASINIDYSNKTKLEIIDKIIEESRKVIQLYIDELWPKNSFNLKFVDFKVDTWLSARMLQCLGKQALSIIKSQRKRKKKTKPTFNGNSIELDSRFIDFQFDSNSFDVWTRLSSIGNGIKLCLPSKNISIIIN